MQLPSPTTRRWSRLRTRETLPGRGWLRWFRCSPLSPSSTPLSPLLCSPPSTGPGLATKMAEKNYDATVFLVMKCIMSVIGMTRIYWRQAWLVTSDWWWLTVNNQVPLVFCALTVLMDCIKQMNSRLSISVVFLVLFWSMSGGILKSISGVFQRYRVVFFNLSPQNLAKSQSLYKTPYSNFLNPILLLSLGLREGLKKKNMFFIHILWISVLPPPPPPPYPHFDIL